MKDASVPGGTYCDNLAKPKDTQQAAAPDELNPAFSGTLIRIAYGTGADGGSATVYVDGKPVGNLNFGGPSASRVPFGAKKYAPFTGLKESTNHHLLIKVDHGSAFLDGFPPSGPHRLGRVRAPRLLFPVPPTGGLGHWSR